MGDFLTHVREHVVLSGSALAIALIVAIPLGAWIAHDRRFRGFTLGAVGVGRVVPSLAVLALLLPIVGVGFTPALVALVLLAIPPIVINTEVGLRGVPAALLDAARGIGMSERQLRRRVEWPLALPVVMSGVRTATVEVISSATLAAFIGGGGLGEYILDGVAGNDTFELFEGAGTVALLALIAEWGLGAVERRLQRQAVGARPAGEGA